MARKRVGAEATKVKRHGEAEGAARAAGDPAYQDARTPLGAELRRLRARGIEAGEPLLSWDDISKEIAERRGGIE